MAEEELECSEMEAVLATRAELGQSYDKALVESLADRIERAVDRRVAEELAVRHRQASLASRGSGLQLALGIISIVAAIPISIVLGLNSEFVSLVITLASLVAVNYALAWQTRGHPGP